MSVTAHITEMFVLKKEIPFLNIKWLVLASYFPDGWGLSKVLLFTTGIDFHRDIFFGWLHSLPVTGLIAYVIYRYFGRSAGASFLIGTWLHVISDSFDTIGVKFFYPFSNHLYSFGLWPWTDGPLVLDLINYYTSPVSLSVEVVMLVWCVYAISSFGSTGNIGNRLTAMWKSDSWRSSAKEVS